MRPTRQQWAMGLAELTALRATCYRRKVGAVLLSKRGHVLATGYNGVAAGLPHCNEETSFIAGAYQPEIISVYGHACSGAKAASGKNLDNCQAIHAEQNALLQCRDVYEIHEAYVTTSPCITCCKLLLNTGCQVIYFREEYTPQPQSKELWVSSGRQWVRLEGE